MNNPDAEPNPSPVPEEAPPVAPGSGTGAPTARPLWLRVGAAAGAAMLVGAFATLAAAGLGLPPFGQSRGLPLPVPQTGGPVIFESDPSGATVRLDEAERGQTPLTFDSLAIGWHQLSLSFPGYQVWVGQIQVLSGAPLRQRIGLTQLPAHLTLETSLEGVALKVDGISSGFLPISLDLAPGERLIRLEAPGRDPLEEKVLLLPRETRSFYVTTSGSELNLVPGDPSRSLAVVVDNLVGARPQTGLDRADVVYEALVEGGITRFLAVFLIQDADVVGPVRSARHYFVPWANEYRAPLVHIGASPQGFAALAASPVPDLNSFTTWRDPNRPAPHDAYTSTQTSLDALRQRQPGSFGGLHFKLDGESSAGTGAMELIVTYGGAYTVSWTYDPEQNNYLRNINGRPHLDRASGDTLRAKNILVLRMQSYPIPDDPLGRLDFAQTGSGPLQAFLDGVKVEGRWTRASLTGVTQYWDDQNRPLEINPGNTWIEIVPPGARVDIRDLS